MLYSIVHVVMETTKMSNFTRQSQLVSCNPSLAMIWQMTYIHKLLKLCSATLMAHNFSKSGTCRPIVYFWHRWMKMPRVKPYKICIVVRQKSNLVEMFVIN